MWAEVHIRIGLCADISADNNVVVHLGNCNKPCLVLDEYSFKVWWWEAVQQKADWNLGGKVCQSRFAAKSRAWMRYSFMERLTEKEAKPILKRAAKNNAEQTWWRRGGWLQNLGRQTMSHSKYTVTMLDVIVAQLCTKSIRIFLEITSSAWWWTTTGLTSFFREQRP